MKLNAEFRFNWGNLERQKLFSQLNIDNLELRVNLKSILF